MSRRVDTVGEFPKQRTYALELRGGSPTVSEGVDYDAYALPHGRATAT